MMCFLCFSLCVLSQDNISICEQKQWSPSILETIYVFWISLASQKSIMTPQNVKAASLDGI